MGFLKNLKNRFTMNNNNSGKQEDQDGDTLRELDNTVIDAAERIEKMREEILDGLR